MTGKLMKYEIKSSGKLMLMIWAALIIASILFSLSINVLGNTTAAYDTNGYGILVGIIGTVTGLLYFAMFIALIVATMLVIILRFYKGLLGDEGYLMHTLPVKPWQLITSKGVVAAGIVFASIIVGLISIMVIAGVTSVEVIPEFFDFMGDVWDADHRYMLIMAELLILIILSVLKSIYQVYAALAIGQLANKYRILLAIGAYIGISIAVTVLFMVTVMSTDKLGVLAFAVKWIDSVGDDIFAVSQMGIVTLFLLTAVQLAGFHVIAERILATRLNLQ